MSHSVTVDLYSLAFKTTNYYRTSNMGLYLYKKVQFMMRSSGI